MATSQAQLIAEAKAAIDTIIKMINGEKVQKVQMIPMIVITKANVKDYYTP